MICRHCQNEVSRKDERLDNAICGSVIEEEPSIPAHYMMQALTFNISQMKG